MVASQLALAGCDLGPGEGGGSSDDTTGGEIPPRSASTGPDCDPSVDVCSSGSGHRATSTSRGSGESTTTTSTSGIEPTTAEDTTTGGSLDTDTDTDTDGIDVPAVCDHDFFPDSERDCGVLDRDACAEHGGTEGCFLASVETCVLLAIEDDVTFEYIEVSTGPEADEKEELSLKVLPAWRSQQDRTGFFDACTTLSDVTLHAAAPLEACADLACVSQALADAPIATECGADIDCA